MAAAVSGIALTVAWPTTAAVPASATAEAAPAGAEVHVPASARVDFDRAALSTTLGADARLDAVMTASAGSATPAAAKGALTGPLDALVETSGFGFRPSPMTGLGELHRGQDFSAACGARVYSAAAGTVTFAGWHPYGGGNRIVVDHGNGLETTYNHLSVIEVSEGQQVRRGERVGQSGSTGASTGCHLHFEVMIEGQVVDPLGWL